MASNSTADTIRNAAGALSSGKSVDSNSSLLSSGDPTPATGVTIDEGTWATGQESTQDDLLPGSADPSNSQDSDESADTHSGSADEKSTPGAKETITVTDSSGRRRQVEVDFADRAAVRKAFEMQHGARKWQAERDQARKELEAVRAQLEPTTQVQKNWDTLESAWQRKGMEGVIDLLQGQAGAFQQWQKKVIDRHEYMRNASPEERQALESRERADESKREVQRIQRENAEFRKQMAAEREQADMAALESRVHPVFDKYRFSEKLGNADNEHMFDEMLWNTALKRLEPYEDKGLPITPELIDREFRNVASAIRKQIGQQADRKASTAVKQQTRAATENVQSAVKSGYKTTGGAAQEARALIEGRNLTGLLSNWKKYGGLFNK